MEIGEGSELSKSLESAEVSWDLETSEWQEEADISRRVLGSS